LIDLRGALSCIWRHKFIQIDHEHESTYRCAILLQVPFIVVVRAGLLVTVAAYQCTVAGSVVERVCRKQDGKLNCQYSDKNMLRFLPNRQRTITLLLAFVTRASSFSNLYSLSRRIMRRRIEQYMKSSGKYQRLQLRNIDSRSHLHPNPRKFLLWYCRSKLPRSSWQNRSADLFTWEHKVNDTYGPQQFWCFNKKRHTCITLLLALCTRTTSFHELQFNGRSDLEKLRE
jgi:hypothetical protein